MPLSAKQKYLFSLKSDQASGGTPSILSQPSLGPSITAQNADTPVLSAAPPRKLKLKVSANRGNTGNKM